jgi:hypothetical protein
MDNRFMEDTIFIIYLWVIAQYINNIIMINIHIIMSNVALY